MRRLRIVWQVLTAPFITGLSVKRESVRQFVTGSLIQGESIMVAELLIDAATTIVMTERDTLIELGRAKEAKTLYAAFKKLKTK